MKRFRLVPFLVMVAFLAFMAQRIRTLRSRVEEPAPSPAPPAHAALPPPPDPLDAPAEVPAPVAEAPVPPPEEEWVKENVKLAAGLAWLARAQNPDGSWGTGLEEFEGSTYSKQGATALAILALLDAGYSHLTKGVDDGVALGEVVKNGMKWLRDNPPQGAFDTALASLALAEAYVMTNSAVVKALLDPDLDALQRYQSANGSWGNDASTSAFVAMTFNALRMGGVEGQEAAAASLKDWYARRLAGDGSPSDAAGWALLLDTKDPDLAARARTALAGRSPSWGAGEMTYGWIASVALHRVPGADDERAAWKKAVIDEAKPANDASWFPADHGTAAVVRSALARLNYEAWWEWQPMGAVEKK